MEKIRLGIIGCGVMQGAHTDGFLHLEDICKVTATCDIVKERAEAAANALGAEFFTTDYKEMSNYVDAVLIVLPHQLHFECGMFFLGENKHVLMEKPLCNTEEECVALSEEAEKRNLVLMCAYPVRYWAGVRKLKELLDSGKYGEIFQMSIWTEQYTDTSRGDWMGDAKKLGGGQLFSHGCHYIDLLLWFLGNPVSGVHFGTNKGTPWMEKEGSSNVILTFENGAMAYHFGTWGARGSVHDYDFQIHTDKGFFEYSHTKSKLIFRDDKGPDAGEVKEIVWSFEDSTKQTQYETRHFLECIINHKKPLTDARSSIQSLRVIWKLYEAEENNAIADLRGLGIPE
ncbi:MAG: Gfo/Idh/MocA family oxidoreductase [Clostridia bacterium]|nr:Gfo/Idh/MocA family oxidoreductase [Clostridia bacterium]